MSYKILILFILSMPFIANASVSFREATRDLVDPGETGRQKYLEAWVKYTCVGPVTPRGKPVKHANIVTFHYPVKLNESYPTVKKIQDQDHRRFEKIARICTERRLAMTDLTGFTGQWLGWDTAYYDAKLAISEVFITNNSCRALGSPCLKPTQCCSTASSSEGRQIAKVVTCNKETNTCEQRRLDGVIQN